MKTLILSLFLLTLICTSSIHGLARVTGRIGITVTASTTVRITSANAGVWVIQPNKDVYFNPYSDAVASTDIKIGADATPHNTYPVYFAIGKTVSFKSLVGNAYIRGYRYE